MCYLLALLPAVTMLGCQPPCLVALQIERWHAAATIARAWAQEAIAQCRAALG